MALMDENDFVKRFKAAERLLKQEKITFKTFENLRTLIKGIDPRVDKKLASCSQAVKTLKQVQKKKVFVLSEKVIKKLPAKSEKQKKRKKALLLLIKYWKQLKAEVKRLTKTHESIKKEKKPSLSQQALNFEKITKIVTSAKGPLGLITLAALGIVGVKLLASYLNTSAVEVVIRNRNCQPLEPVVSLPVSLPGLELPEQAIPDGGQAIAKLPPLNLSVDGSQPGLIKISALKLTMNFELNDEGIDLLYNGRSLLGQRTIIKLGKQPTHELVVSCR